jgi:hypothetical protein
VHLAALQNEQGRNGQFEGVATGLLSPTNVDGAQTALRYLDAHMDILLNGGFPKLKPVRFMNDGVLEGHPELKQLAPQTQSYLATFGAWCSAMSITSVLWSAFD